MTVPGTPARHDPARHGLLHHAPVPHYFMRKVNDWEKVLVDEGIDLIKIYLSVSQETQDLRFKLRSTRRPAILEILGQ